METMPPRLVATDLDGTLVRSDGTVSDRTRAALALVEQAGATLVLVTGRPPRWMAPVVAETGHRGVAVCANGALVYDLRTERVVRSHLMDAGAAAQVVEALRRDVPGIAFAVEQGPVDGVPGGFGREEVYVPRWDVGDVLVAPLEELVAAGAVKLLARHDAMTSDDLLAVARQSLGGLAEATHSSADGLLEISAAGISKASGLAALAAEHGVGAATWSRSATCRTTCRCSPGRGTPWRSRTPTPRSGRQPTRSPPATTTTASPGCSSACSPDGGCCTCLPLRLVVSETPRMRSRLPALAVVLCLVSAAVAPALAEPGRQFPDASTGVREDTPNDPGFDCSESDDEDAVARGGTVENCGAIWDAQSELWGFAPESTARTAVHRQGPRAGQPMRSGISADAGWKTSVGRPDVSIAILDTGIRWDSEELRLQVALNAGELPSVPDVDRQRRRERR
jgi:hydroxymethylpyrimidine pyrophosphatase-like HAD family hydrolase